MPNTMTRNIVKLAGATPDIAALWLYGSRARGDHHDNSDYDLAVAYTTWETDPLERRLRPELLAGEWQAALGLTDKELSVVDVGIAPIPLGVAILDEGVLLLDREPDIRMTQEHRILSRWAHDYQPQIAQGGPAS